MKTLIFEKPSLAPLPHRVGWAFFTAFFWILWVYLWMPLLTVFIWALGFGAYGEYFTNTAGIQLHQIERIAMLYTSIIGALGGGLLLWARVEFMRFGKLSRRVVPVAVATEELAAYAGLPAHDIEAWKMSRRVAAHHDQHGHLRSADSLNHFDTTEG